MSKIVAVLASVKLALHLATAGHYPLHRDELYYFLCGRHPAWSYPDHPPLVPWLAGATEHLFGLAPFWLRLWPALAGATMVLLAGWLAWRLGGGVLAQALAALALTVSPVFLLSNSLMQTVSLDQLFWVASAAVLVAIIDGASRRLFLLFGLLLGLGLLAKFTIVAWGFGVLVGLLVTRERTLLRSPWPWLGALIAVACAAPMLIWQVQHGWPLLQFASAIRADEAATPWGFLAMVAGMSGPIVGTLLLLGGFVFLLGAESGRRWRALGVAVAVAWGLFLVSGGKPYYVAATFPMLFAGGAVLAESILMRRASRVLRTGTVLMLASQVWMLPAFLPVLPPRLLAGLVEYLPQDDWQNMFGWEEIAEQTAKAYNELSPEEQIGLRVLTGNYGVAGAIDVYGAQLGLPAAISGHNGYAFWETAPALDPLIVIGYDAEWLRQSYSEVRALGVLRGSELLKSEEEGAELFYCRGLLTPSDLLWKRLKHFD